MIRSFSSSQCNPKHVFGASGSFHDHYHVHMPSSRFHNLEKAIVRGNLFREGK